VQQERSELRVPQVHKVLKGEKELQGHKEHKVLKELLQVGQVHKESKELKVQ